MTDSEFGITLLCISAVLSAPIFAMIAKDWIRHMNTPRYIPQGMMVSEDGKKIVDCGGYWVSRWTGKKVNRYD